MNRNELAMTISKQSKLSRSEAVDVVDLVFGSITEALQGGDEVKIVGFGSFIVADRAASEGRNPKTGEPIQIPASKVPRFKAGKALREALNNR